MSPRFEIQDAKVWHCGMMARKLREETRDALRRFDARAHQELRDLFNQSAWKKVWLIDGELGALGGVTGPTLAGGGTVWLAFSKLATRYPKAMAIEAKRQIEILSEHKRELSIAILPDDPASLRFALYLGFSCENLPGSWGRRWNLRQIERNPDVRKPIGNSYVIPMVYRQEAAPWQF